MCEEVWCVQEGCACVRKCDVCRRGVHVWCVQEGCACVRMNGVCVLETQLSSNNCTAGRLVQLVAAMILSLHEYFSIVYKLFLGTAGCTTTVCRDGVEDWLIGGEGL